MTKWYENIARMCNIPLIMIDIPYNNTVEVHDENVKYVRAQFDKAIKQLEELTGKKFDEKKFEQVNFFSCICLSCLGLNSEPLSAKAEFPFCGLTASDSILFESIQYYMYS